MRSKLYFILTLLAFSTFVVNAQQAGAGCPMHEKHGSAQTKASGKAEANRATRHDQMREMNERGDKAMGFSQNRTTHHFRLLNDGGAIEVEATNAQDTTSRERIRAHLQHISQMFAEGNFDAPIFIHDQTVPGVSVMQRLKSEIEYGFEQTERGGRLRIKTNNPEALAAIHDFLRFQITEHATGDAMEMQN